MARPEGFEPSTREVEARCSDPLSYGRLVAPRVGLEPTTSAFEARRSITELTRQETTSCAVV